MINLRNRNVCLIVGAGASKGAFLKAKHSPPLDAEFIETIERIFKNRRKNYFHREGKKEWEKFKGSLKNIGLRYETLSKWRLESLTTYLEARSNVNFENKKGRPTRYKDALERLKKIICYTLALTGGLEDCPMHKTLIEHVDPNSIRFSLSVISFNYDLILDQTLLKMDKLNWSAANYSSCATVDVIKAGKSKSRRLFKTRRYRKGDIDLYKLHGSMHWNEAKREGGFRLSGIESLPSKKLQYKSFQYSAAPSNPFIVPPVAAKTVIASSQLNKVWSSAHKRLKSSSVWVVWGYSFPPTDTITSVLLKTCVKDARSGKKTVIIINPDYTTVKRVEDLLGKKVHILHFSSAADFLLRQEKISFN